MPDRTPPSLAFVTALLAGSLSAGAAAAHDWLPLGDGRVSKEPRAGYVFFCPTNITLNDDTTPGPWISNDGMDASR
jgi:hypothetical protein